MSTQQLLFGDMNQHPPMPAGFRYQEEALTAAEESDLLKCIATVPLKPFDFHGYTALRNVASFGYRYNYERRIIEPATEFPPFLQELRARAAAFANQPVSAIEQGGINQYPPGAGIGWHRDRPHFGLIVVVSLCASATLRLRRNTGKEWLRSSQTVTPRSMYVLSGDARQRWEHSVPPVEHLRYSLTFRTINHT